MTATLLDLMKTLAPYLVLLALLAAVFCAGCATGAKAGDHHAIIQTALDATLPRTFNGPVSFAHKNAWFDVTITGGDVRYVDGRWVWSWLRYVRNGRFSHGVITLGTSPTP